MEKSDRLRKLFQMQAALVERTAAKTRTMNANEVSPPAVW
jgi:hypothetical protein